MFNADRINLHKWEFIRATNIWFDGFIEKNQIIGLFYCVHLNILSNVVLCGSPNYLSTVKQDTLESQY